MRIGVVSDTHGHLEYARPAVELLSLENVEQILHCGDIGSVEVVKLFADWPAHFVFGNTDFDKQTLRDAMQKCGHTCHELFGDFELGGRRIALLHGHERHQLREAVSSDDYDLVCTGHTHERSLHRQGRTVLLNPGALYRTAEHSVAVVDLETLEIDHRVIYGC